MTTLQQTDTIAHTFQVTASAWQDQPALRSEDGSIDWTWREYSELVQRLAGGLDALGCRHGDTIACWLSNRPEFHVTLAQRAPIVVMSDCIA